ncbi:MAG TPA: alpha/beta-hydrolase N-terminal domain-containing protein, partial [Lacipirellulaceae bacterium]|nr:alpha/beta-hydrolase N-terminal domain-containing protein [Lacipirellulaceae bacterium]
MGRLASHLRHWFVSSCSSFSFVGLAVATLFFAASMTPSLLPRHYAVQGVLSGFALAAGYGVGVFLVWAWQFLELPRPGERLDRASKQATAAVVAV